MSVTPQSARRPTGLRDFGAFQVDISTLATREVVAIEVTEGSNSLSFKGDERDEKAGQIIDYQQRSKAIAQKVSRKKWLKFAIRAGLTLLLFVFLFRSLSWSALVNGLAHMHRGAVLVAFVVGASGIVLSCYQWRSLLLAEHIHFDLADLINLYVVGIAFSHFLPTGMGGDAIKALRVGRESGNNIGSASAVVMCRVTGFFGMLLVALPVLLIQHQHFTASLMLSFILLTLLVGSMIGGAIFLVIFAPRLFKERWSNSRLAHHRILNPVLRLGNALTMTLQRPRSLVMAVIYGVVFWILAILNCYAYAGALSIHASLSFYFVVVPLISLLAFLPISINGFGVRESAFVYAFSIVHVPAATALLLALLLDVQALCFGAIGACIYFTMDNKTNSVKQRRAA